MDLNDIVSRFGLNGKETVYMSVTPGVGLELLQLDVSAKTIKNYAYRPLEYNDSLREIASIDDFKNAVLELFEELNINKKSNLVLNLPLVNLGSKDLPLMIGDEAINEALTSETEQSYIFKRYEPIVSWFDSNSMQSGDSRRLFYSAIQKNTVDNLKKALSDLGITLVGIETSITSILKALDFANLAEEQMKDGISWNLLLVNQTGYSICSMMGKKLIDYYEEPLAIKSFEGEEIYNAINASAQIALMSYPANYLYIISETNLVSAEILASRLQSDVTVKFIENNQFKKENVLPVSLEVLEQNASKISLEAIGVATGANVVTPVSFNFLGNSQGDVSVENANEPVHVVLGSFEFDISPFEAAKRAIISTLILVPLIIMLIAVPMVQKQKQSHLDDLKSKLDAVESKIKELEDAQNKTKDFDVNTEIRRVLNDNRSKLMAYLALGDSVPKDLWLTYFVAKDDGKINVKGQTSNVEDVYAFYKNMKDSLINIQLRLNKLELESGSVDDVVNLNQASNYQFEITNISESGIAPKTETAPTGENNSQDNNGAQNDNTRKGQLLNKPLINNNNNGDLE